MNIPGMNSSKSKCAGRFLLLILSLNIFVITNSFARDNKELQLHRFEEALQLTPDINNGRELYRLCITCHGPEGWGTQSGSYPQIAGQLHTVTIKQLGDICSNMRANPIMEAFTTPRVLETGQDVADLAAYIAQLPMTRDNGQGSSYDLKMGKQVYEKNCTQCHGEQGEGHVEDQVPRIQGQHYNYLKRQFNLIRGGHRRNADNDMKKHIQDISLREESAVLAYISSLVPSANNLAKPEWRNPDFPEFDRKWSLSRPVPRHKLLSR